MGWTFHRSFNFGPLRVNLSKKGAGISLGSRGFRVGKDAAGRQYTHTSIPGTGIYRRDYYKSAPPQANQTNPPHRYLSSKYFWLLMLLAVGLWVILRLLR